MAFNIPGFGSYEPNRPKKPRRSRPVMTPEKKKRARTIGIVIAVIVGLVLVIPPLVKLYTSFLWYRSVGKAAVFGTMVGIRIGMFLIFGLVSALVVYGALELAFRIRPRDDLLPKNPALEPYRRIFSSKRVLTFSLAALVAGIMFGISAQSDWQLASLFFNHESFGQVDPQYGKDLGFYAFQLPFLSLIVHWLTILAGLAFAINLVLHYILGSLVLRPRNKSRKAIVRMAAPARKQVSIIGTILILFVGLGYWLDRYELLSDTIVFKDQTITGAGYTSVNVLLPAKLLLTVIAVLCAAAFFASFFLRDLRIPALAVVLMLVSGVLVGSAWPFVVEQFSVKPNKAAKEKDFIDRNIKATRFAYNLGDDNLTVKRNFGKESAPVPKPGDKGVAATIGNIRLLDPNVLSPAFTQSKQLRSFYGFSQTLAIDRYTVDGRLRDYVVAVREINPSALTGNQKDWINRHTVYTHGNGFVTAPANTVDEIVTDAGDRGGNPKYEVYDIQSIRAKKKDKAKADSKSEAERDAAAISEGANLRVNQPRIYYGPLIAQQDPDYAIVKTAGGAQEYDTDGENYTYTGQGGVPIGNVFNRLAYTIDYTELNFLLSRLIGDESKLLLNRDPRDRVELVAPWLTVDTAVYPAIIDGRIKWIVDGYTTLDNLPYAQKLNLAEVTADAQSGKRERRSPNKQISYMRNSVKAVVDAYDGSVKLYEFDDKDPVLKTWMKVFPGVVQPRSAMSDELVEHIRYPEDLFKAQREILSRYHVTAPLNFYTGGSYWQVPNEPTIGEGGEETEAAREGLYDQPPYYVVSADPRTGRPSFQLTTPMLWNKREFLSAQISVSSDPDNYGHITIRQWPTTTTTQGPKNALDRMTSAGGYQTEKLQLEGANEIIYGNLLTLPIGDGGVLYVEPLYAQRKGQESAYPKLIRVMVMFNDRLGYGRSLATALEQVGLDGSMVDKPEGFEEDPDAPALAEPSDGTKTRDEAAAKLSEAIAAVRQAQSSGDLGSFGKALEELDKAAQDYQKAAG